MAKAKISPALQIKRINEIRMTVDSFKEMNSELLTKRPSEKSWCALEVIEHMNIAHKVYEAKIDTSLSKIGDRKEPIDQLEAKRIPSILINRFPPVEGTIKFKMKTFKKFEPLLNLDTVGKNEIDKIIETFNASLNHLHSSIESYRMKDVTSNRFNSAVGASVRFNVAEACEFIICHNERHLQQIKNVLKMIEQNDK
jgi:hypothetical protein